MSRVLIWWSAGVASSVAAALALRMYEDEADEWIVAYCDTSSTEHSDNERFLSDCERWYGQPILRIRSEKYRDTWDVYRRTGWLVGVAGARCTTELKKKVRQRFQRPGDIHVFGFTAGESKRWRRFEARNSDIDARFPLVERGLSHADCLAILREAEVEIPEMYRLGYRNNNCIGCVKGGAGYWNKIRRDFPAVFDRMAALERDMDVAILKRQRDGVRERVFLDQLDPDAGRYQAEPDVECGVGCGLALKDIRPANDEVFNEDGVPLAAGGDE